MEGQIKHVNRSNDDVTEHTFGRYTIAEANTLGNEIKEDINRLYKEACAMKILLTAKTDLKPDIPLHSLHSYLAKCIQVLKAGLTNRKTLINSLLENEKIFCNALGKCPRQLTMEPVLPTLNELNEFYQYIIELKREKLVRQKKLENLRKDIRTLSSKLTRFDLTVEQYIIWNDPKPKLSNENLLAFHEILQYVQTSIRKQIDQIKNIFNKVYIQTEEKKSTKQYEEMEFKSLDDELESWKRKLNLKGRITKVRDQTEMITTKICLTEYEKSEFLINFNSNLLTLDLLAAYEAELKRVRKIYVADKKLFDLIGQRNKLRHLRDGVIHNTADRDEKIIINEIFDIEMNILQLAAIYQKKNNQKFKVYGTPVSEYLAEDVQHKLISF